MYKNTLNRQYTLNLLIFLFMTLFIYAAVLKVAEYNLFRAQIAKSPLIFYYAHIVAWLIPALEILTAILLFIPKFRRIGFYLFFSIMFAFTIYIILMMVFSPSLPCSCGGILNKLDWTEHLIFNIIFTAFAVLAIYVDKKNPKINQLQSSTRHSKTGIKILTNPITLLLTCITVITTTMLIMYWNSPIEANLLPAGFKRTFDNNLKVVRVTDVSLNDDQYYIAGATRHTIYIASPDAPFDVLSFDQHNKKFTKKTIHLLNTTSIRNPRQFKISIDSPNFTISNGTMKRIYHGNTDSWNATNMYKDTSHHFVDATPITRSTTLLRSYSNWAKMVQIARYTTTDTPHFKFKHGILEKQADGIICVHGTISIDPTNHKIVYVYAYRNGFIVMDSTLSLKYKGSTIDTFSQANVKLAKVSDRQTMTASPPSTINSASASYDEKLFITSNLLADNESISKFLSGTVTDIYNVNNGKYIESIYIPDNEEKKVTGLRVLENSIITIQGKHLSIYNMHNPIENQTSKK